MQQQQFFSLPSSYAFSIKLELDGTWTLMACKLYVGQPFDERNRETYTDLSLAEASSIVDVFLSVG